MGGIESSCRCARPEKEEKEEFVILSELDQDSPSQRSTSVGAPESSSGDSIEERESEESEALRSDIFEEVCSSGKLESSKHSDKIVMGVPVGCGMDAKILDEQIEFAEMKEKELLENAKEEQDVLGLNADTRELYIKGLECTLNPSQDWMVGFEGKLAKITYQHIPGNSYLWAHARFQIKNATLDEVIAGTGELTEWPTWHPTVYKIEKIGPRTPTDLGNRAENSVALGFIKFYTNTKLNRFIGPGYVLEVLQDAKEGDAEYAPPTRGMNRGSLEAYTMFIPTPAGIMVIQHARVELPIAIPHWLVTWVMKYFSQKIMDSFQSLMDLVKSDKNNFKQLMAKDEVGLYAILRKIQAEAEKDYLVKDWRDTSRLANQFSKHIPIDPSPSLRKSMSTVGTVHSKRMRGSSPASQLESVSKFKGRKTFDFFGRNKSIAS